MILLVPQRAHPRRLVRLCASQLFSRCVWSLHVDPQRVNEGYSDWNIHSTRVNSITTFLSAPLRVARARAFIAADFLGRLCSIFERQHDFGQIKSSATNLRLAFLRQTPGRGQRPLEVNNTTSPFRTERGRSAFFVGVFAPISLLFIVDNLAWVYKVTASSPG